MYGIRKILHRSCWSKKAIDPTHKRSVGRKHRSQAHEPFHTIHIFQLPPEIRSARHHRDWSRCQLLRTRNSPVRMIRSKVPWNAASWWQQAGSIHQTIIRFHGLIDLSCRFSSGCFPQRTQNSRCILQRSFFSQVMGQIWWKCRPAISHERKNFLPQETLWSITAWLTHFTGQNG